MRVLVAVPEYPREPAVHPLTEASLAALRAQVPRGVPEPLGRGGELVVWRLGGDNPAWTHYENLCAKHNRARQRVLDEGFDALLSVEADMVIPPDAPARLAAVDADVAYGLYVSRRAFMWLLFEAITAKGGTSIAKRPERAAAVWGQVVPSAGAGMGCTLIHRRVLEQVSFRLIPNSPFADDWSFALDVAAAGFRQAHDTAVVCGHVVRDGLVVWPDVRQEERANGARQWVLHRLEEIPRPEGSRSQPAAGRSYARYVALKTLHLGDTERYVRPGEVVELGADAARALLRRQAVTPAEEAEPEGRAVARGRRAAKQRQRKQRASVQSSE